MAITQEFLKSIGLDDETLAEKLIAKSTEDETGLVNKRDELLGKVTTYKDQLKGFEGVDAIKYHDMLKKLDAISEAEDLKNGDFEKIRLKMLEDFEKKEGVSSDTITKLMGQIESLMVDSEVAKAIAEAKGNSKLLMPLLKQRIKVVDKDGSMVVKVTEDNGDPSVNDKGEPLSITALVESFKKDENFAGAFDSSGLSGGGGKPSGSGGGSDDDTVFGASRMAAARTSK